MVLPVLFAIIFVVLYFGIPKLIEYNSKKKLKEEEKMLEQKKLEDRIKFLHKDISDLDLFPLKSYLEDISDISDIPKEHQDYLDKKISKIQYKIEILELLEEKRKLRVEVDFLGDEKTRLIESNHAIWLENRDNARTNDAILKAINGDEKIVIKNKDLSK